MNIKLSLLYIFFLAGFILTSSCKEGTAQSNSDESSQAHTTPEGLKWYSIDDLSKVDIGSKKILIDVYTSWCGWCKVMDAKTFTDPGIVAHLKKNFILVKFDAEQQTPVSFKGNKYEWMASGRNGINQLAIELLNGQLGYPTIVYLDKDLNKIRVAPGYKTPEQLMGELQVL